LAAFGCDGLTGKGLRTASLESLHQTGVGAGRRVSPAPPGRLPAGPDGDMAEVFPGYNYQFARTADGSLVGWGSDATQSNVPAVDKHIIERRNGRLPGFGHAVAREKAQFKLL
jgi:hypothetical protein